MTESPTFARLDYAPAPGALLEETLDDLEISARELARRCGRSPKLITEIVSGKAALEPETALQFESVLGIEASVWLNLEAAYRLHLAREAEKVSFTDAIAWLKKFPLPDLHKRGIISNSRPSADLVRELLRFFGVASVEACDANCEAIGLSYRHSPSFSTDRHALFAWLRTGELEAEKMECAEFDRSKLMKALGNIRTLAATTDIQEFLPKIKQELSKAGVAFVIAKPFGKIALSGVSRWLSPRKALIQLTLRHKSDDHFWFTLFHEAAHLLLHSRKTVFVDGRGKEATGSKVEEEEANSWAADFLIPREAFSIFRQSPPTAGSVRRFAREIGVSPGIVVGQLQNAGVITFGYLNELKVRYQWLD